MVVVIIVFLFRIQDSRGNAKHEECGKELGAVEKKIVDRVVGHRKNPEKERKRIAPKTHAKESAPTTAYAPPAEMCKTMRSE